MYKTSSLMSLANPFVEYAQLDKYLSFVQINDNMHGSKQLPQRQEETTGQMGILIENNLDDLTRSIPANPCH